MKCRKKREQFRPLFGGQIKFEILVILNWPINHKSNFRELSIKLNKMIDLRKIYING